MIGPGFNKNPRTNKIWFFMIFRIYEFWSGPRQRGFPGQNWILSIFTSYSALFSVIWKSFVKLLISRAFSIHGGRNDNAKGIPTTCDCLGFVSFGIPVYLFLFQNTPKTLSELLLRYLFSFLECNFKHCYRHNRTQGLNALIKVTPFKKSYRNLIIIISSKFCLSFKIWTKLHLQNFYHISSWKSWPKVDFKILTKLLLQYLD